MSAVVAIDVQQLLIDAFSINDKLLRSGGKTWMYDSTVLSAAYLRVLYGLKNKNLKDEDILDLHRVSHDIQTKWQEAN